MAAYALETVGLVKRFGGFTATNGVSFGLEPGARHALIGPNGAGKTTFVNLLSGSLDPSAGRVLLGGEDVTRLPPDRRVRRGLVRTFQINQLYRDLTPVETIGLAVSQRMGVGGGWWRRLGTRQDIDREIADIAARFRLDDVLGHRTSTLPYGRQRLLELAAAFACRPRVLLLDEPAAGVPQAERQDVLAAVASLPRDVAVLLIEHDMDLVFSFADRITVMVEGTLLVSGPAAEVAADPRVRAVYLGEGGGEGGHG